MSVRQYIGARYVPRFSDVNGGVWSNVYSYEPLIIVKNGNDYYTSKKSVPVGIAITNTEYWAPTGNYNGAIASLDQKIDTVKAELETKISQVNDRKFIFIGDSYAGTLVSNNYIKIAAGILGLVENTDYYLSYIGGAGFYGDNGNVTFLARLQALNASIEDKESITDIIVLGGINDRDATLTQIDQRMAEFNTYARTNYPNAKISLGAIGWSTNGEYVSKYTGTVIPAYSRCGKYGWKFYDNIMYTLHVRSFMADTLHPTQDAHYLLAYNLVDCILSGSCNVHYSMANDTGLSAMPYSLTLNSHFTEPDNIRKFAPNVRFFLDNGTVNVEMSQTIQFHRDEAGFFGTFVEVGHLTDHLIGFSSAAKSGYISVMMILIDSSNQQHPVDGRIVICNDGTVYVRANSALQNIVDVIIYQTSDTLQTLRN